MRFKISLFDNKRDAAPKPAERTWQQICDRVKSPRVQADKDGSLFSPAIFDPPRRAKENVVEVSLLVLDYDHAANFDRDTAVWRELGLSFAAYTTHSSHRVTQNNPEAEERFRVILPLLEPVPSSEFPKLWQWAARASDGKVDASAKDSSRMFYTPAIASADARYRFDLHDGELLDWRKLDLQAIAEPVSVQPISRQSDNYGQAALREEAARVLTASNGSRNNQLNKSAFALGQLAVSGLLTESEIEATLERAAIGAGLNPGEARGTIKSGLTAGMQEPRLLPASHNSHNSHNSSFLGNSAISANCANEPEETEWELPAAFDDYELPEFPVESLPNWLRAFVTGLARETQTPPDLPAMLTLSACAGAVAGNVEIEARRGWREPLNLFAVVAIPPANRKSAVFASTAQPLESFEVSLIADQREAVARAESERRTLTARLDHLEKTAAKLDDENERREKQREAARLAEEIASMEVPKLPRLLADDATPETLATLLSDQKGRIALFSPEGDLFDLMAGRYSSGTPNLGVFLKGHAGDDLRVDRRSRSEYIKRPSLTIGLAIQPEVLRGLVSKPTFKGRGLLGRFLYSMPKSTLGSRKTRVQPLDEEAKSEYSRRIKAMAGLMVDFDDEGNRLPRMLRLTDDADDYLAAFQDEIEPQLSEAGELASLSDWAGKLAGAVLRIAGILHLTEHAGHFQNWPERVSATTLKQAIEIGRYLIPHAQAAYAEMGADPEIEAAKFLLRWIEKNGGSEFTQRQAFEGTKSRFKKVENLKPALRLLAEQGFIRVATGQIESGRGRKPSQLFLVNPHSFAASHNSHNSHNSSFLGNSAISANCANEDGEASFESSYLPVSPLGSTAREVIDL
ncbi:MAG: YfjI family protein [Acidobacteriota bacterium]|nr:YfjI family protein [Acidobacteriota bacterium]